MWIEEGDIRKLLRGPALVGLPPPGSRDGHPPTEQPLGPYFAPARGVHVEANETGPNEFGKNYTADLAFAGRATSSFPGAFAPISQRSFKTEVGQDADLHPDKVFRYPYGPENPTDDVYCCPALNVQTMASSSVPMIGAWERPRSAL